MMPRDLEQVIKNISVFNIKTDIGGKNIKWDMIDDFTCAAMMKIQGSTQNIPVPMEGGPKRLRIKYFPLSPSYSSTELYVSFEYPNGLTSSPSINPESIDIYPVTGSDTNMISISPATSTTPVSIVSIEMFKINL
jgi:hypothetical protein